MVGASRSVAVALMTAVGVLLMLSTASMAVAGGDSRTLSVPSVAADTGLITASSANTATRTQTWAWPVPSPIHILEPFRAPLTRYTAGHRGVDLAAEVGGTITAPADGVVSFVGEVADKPVVAIEHGTGVVSAMEPVVAAGAPGTEKTPGEPGGVGGGGKQEGGRGYCVGCRGEGRVRVAVAVLRGDSSRGSVAATVSEHCVDSSRINDTGVHAVITCYAHGCAACTPFLPHHRADHLLRARMCGAGQIGSPKFTSITCYARGCAVR